MADFYATSGMTGKILVILFIGFLAFAYQAIMPPPPKICGSPNGAPITALRIKLSDGRHLAYKEQGVPKDQAKYKIIFIHGFDCCRHDVAFASTLSPDVIESLGIYIVSFDRPGYGESDPHPQRTPQSLARDVEELADQLKLGSKFYVTGFSMGGQAVWGCLKYIPHRLAGAALLTPVANFWWPGFPANLTEKIYYNMPAPDLWTVRVAHYLPWLTYWWNTQKFFPSSRVAAHSPDIFSTQDKQLAPRFDSSQEPYRAQIRQQGEFESIHRDMIIGIKTWEFDPMDLEDPFPNNEGSVHIWQGDEDGLVPVVLLRYVAERLPWIRYHEIKGGGHLFPYADGMGDKIMKTFLLGETFVL
ncbi:uncharacterized protein LOC132629853 isoform X1 [Lycium barbarum]|uniref:uncharacterized protein LOC132629853 isoform X1 n=1 Tax=Lycium barbarum TaxID=112863 RepID=UPI00293E9453|nr:uncharacterized protein LOC132629853 isoform X1 [Lycium barbarum]